MPYSGKYTPPFTLLEADKDLERVGAPYGPGGGGGGTPSQPYRDVWFWKLASRWVRKRKSKHGWINSGLMPFVQNKKHFVHCYCKSYTCSGSQQYGCLEIIS